MNNNKIQEQKILGTLVNKDASGILGYSEQIYDTESGKSLAELVKGMEKESITMESIEESARVMDS